MGRPWFLLGVTVLALGITMPAHAQPETKKATAGYDNGFFLASEDGDFKLIIGGRVQARYTFAEPEFGERQSNFGIPRARITMRGHVHGKDTRYMLQIDFSNGGFIMKDFQIDARLFGNVHLRAGQWKRPTSRLFIASTAVLELVDRTLVDLALSGIGRDMGVAIHNNYNKSPELEWVIGVFNGTIADQPDFDGSVDPMTDEILSGKFNNVPSHFAPALIGRVGYNANGVKGYSEPDIWGGSLRWGVGAFAMVGLDTDDDGNSSIRSGIDAIAHLNKVSFTGAFYYGRDDTMAGNARHMGAFGQAGYTLGFRHTFTGRFGWLNPDGPDNTILETTAGWSYYIGRTHNWKLSTDAGAIVTKGAMGDTTDFLARSQLQLAF